MLYKNGCADAWETVIRIYDETIEQNNPAVTAEKIVSEIGLSNAMKVFRLLRQSRRKTDASRQRTVGNFPKPPLTLMQLSGSHGIPCSG